MHTQLRNAERDDQRVILERDSCLGIHVEIQVVKIKPGVPFPLFKKPVTRINCLFITKPSECALFLILTELKAHDENRIVWNRVSPGERRAWFGSQGTRRMSESLGNCCMIRAVDTVSTSENRPPK